MKYTKYTYRVTFITQYITEKYNTEVARVYMR